VTRRRRVAITGLGVVSAIGVGVPSFWSGLLNARSGIRRITRFDPSGLSVQIAAEVPGFLPPALAESRLALLDRVSQFALVAACEACAHAGLSPGDIDADRAGTALGTGFGGVASQEDCYRKLFAEDARRLHPYSIPRVMHNAAASHLSMVLNWRGPTLTFATACAASAHAIGEAGEMIRAGRADVMLAGGAEAPITYGVMRSWESMRVLAPTPAGDPGRACRPFSLERQGLVIGEGAGVLVLEDWDHARRRGAPVLAELAGYGATADAGHITQPGIDAPSHAIALALAQARQSPGDIDYVNAHGTGTRMNDRIETLILKRAFSAHASRIAVSATKSMHGHAMGASAALELIAAILAIQCGIVPPTANYGEPDPECDLDYVPNAPAMRKVDVALSNSFAFGGLNAVLLVRRAAE